MIQGKTILVVDDDPTIRTGVKAILQKHGFQTLEADDGLEAKELIDRQRPDLVLLDMMMPRWGGFLVLEHFSGKSDAPPFVMMTASTVEQHKTQAERVGVADYINKPFTVRRLLQGVEKGLRSAGARQGIVCSDKGPVIRCLCPSCAAQIEARLRLLGQERTCPACQGRFVVRLQPPEDAPPILVGA